MKIFIGHQNSWQREPLAGKGLEHCDLGGVKVRPAESKTVVPGNKGTRVGPHRTVTGEEKWEMLLRGAHGR